MKLALLATDNRAHERAYSEVVPRFGTAPEGIAARIGHVAGIGSACHLLHTTANAIARKNCQEHLFSQPSMFLKWAGCERCIKVASVQRGKNWQKIQPDIIHGQGTERDCAISAVLSSFPNVVRFMAIWQSYRDYFVQSLEVIIG